MADSDRYRIAYHAAALGVRQIRTNAVIFDLDGTLIESEEVWRDVRRELVTAFGLQWNDEAQVAMMGMRTSEWSLYMHDHLGLPLRADEIAERVIAGVAERLSKNVPILPGAQGALERLAAAFPLGLATSAARAVAEAVLSATQWRTYFDAVVSSDEVDRGKPAPDVYLRALHLIGADAESSAAIEDSGNGILSAHAAGLAVVAIPNRAFPPGAAALSTADCILGTIEELQLQTIQSALKQRTVSERQV